MVTTYSTATSQSFYVKRVAKAALSSTRQRDRRGFDRSPVTLADYRRGRAPANKGRKFPPEPLKPAEVLALMEACAAGTAGVRNRALIVALWRGGLRCAEALRLQPKDLDLETGTVSVLHGKGDKARVVCVDRMACEELGRWLEVRRRLVVGQAPVFCVVSQPTVGAPLHSAYVRNLLKELAARAGIEKRVHPHGLRHTHAFELAGERVDMRVIKEQLGHTDLATTARYIEHLNPETRRQLIHERAWPA